MKDRKKKQAAAIVEKGNAPIDINTTSDGIIDGTFGNPSLQLAFGYYRGHTGIAITPFSAMQASAVYSCVKAIAEGVAKLPIKVKRRLPGGGYEEVRNHPVSKLFRRPNAWDYGHFSFHRNVVHSLVLRGNAYIYIVRDNAGRPIELIHIPVESVGVTVSQTTGRIFYWVSHPLLGPSAFQTDDEDIIHLKNLSVDGIFGMSPIALSQDSIGLALAAQEQAATMFRQGLAMQGSLQTEQKMSPEAVQNVAASWAEQHRGLDNTGKTPILHTGLKFVPSTMTSVDAQLLESRKDSRSEIASIFGVPGSKIGLPAEKGGSVEAENQKFVDDNLSSIWCQFKQAYDAKLLDDDESDLEIIFDYQQNNLGDMKTRHAYYATGIGWGYYNINEVREFLHLGPIEGGDTYRVPMNTAPLDSDSLVGAVMGTPPTTVKPDQTMPEPEEKPEGEENENDEDDE